jgi:hypothetical protein
MSPAVPKAYAVAPIRANPVTRDSVVAVDIVSVERATDGLAMRSLLERGVTSAVAGRSRRL